MTQVVKLIENAYAVYRSRVNCLTNYMLTLTTNRPVINVFMRVDPRYKAYVRRQMNASTLYQYKEL
jgi:hypothetical protein